MRFRRGFWFLLLSLQALMSCSKEDDVEGNNAPVIISYDDNNSSSSPNDSLPENTSSKDCFLVSLFASNGHSHQSAAAFGDYAFFITDRRSALYFYDLNSKRMISVTNLGAMDEKTGGYYLYHCNQMTFGIDFFDKNDPFPLLYISQRARDDNRCIVEVFRLLPKTMNSIYTSLDVELVQTIYFPIMTIENSLGRVNCAIDNLNFLLYTYSYSTINSDSNRGKCRISCFNIPKISEKEVILNDEDIIDSFSLDYSGINSQGGCIKDGYLYIGQGYSSVGIYLNIIDLQKKKLQNRIDLLHQGIAWEPEGCFVYQGNIMISSGNNIWQFKSL